MSINILKDFISENAGPISVKFHVQLQGKDWEWGVGVRGWVGVLFEWFRSHDKDGCHIQSIYGIDLKRSRSFSPILLG